MARGRREDGPRTADREFGRLTIEGLRPLAALLVPDPPKRKGELVALLTRATTDPARVRSLYDQLEPVAQLAVGEATHDPLGRYSRTRFVARHGREPDWTGPAPGPHRESHGRPKTTPLPLNLFFAHGDDLPTDVRSILLPFVPPPDPLRLPTRAGPPTEFTSVRPTWAPERSVDPVAVRLWETAREAEADLTAVLRLIDAGRVRVTDKRRVPTEAARRAVAG